jgi:hypothetical protein
MVTAPCYAGARHSRVKFDILLRLCSRPSTDQDYATQEARLRDAGCEVIRASPPEGKRMSTIQLMLLEPQAPRVRLRHVRRPFNPSETKGPYRLPHYRAFVARACACTR